LFLRQKNKENISVVLFPIDEKLRKNQASKKLFVSSNKLRIPNHAFEARPNQKRAKGINLKAVSICNTLEIV
jgi:hypothetical protein